MNRTKLDVTVVVLKWFISFFNFCELRTARVGINNEN